VVLLFVCMYSLSNMGSFHVGNYKIFGLILLHRTSILGILGLCLRGSASPLFLDVHKSSMMLVCILVHLFLASYDTFGFTLEGSVSL